MPFWTTRPDPREESRHGYAPAPAAHRIDVPWEPLTVPATRQRRHHRSRHCHHQVTVDDLLYTAALTETEQAKTAQTAQAEPPTPPGQTSPFPALGTSSTAARSEPPATTAGPGAVVVERNRRPWLLGSALFVASILAGTWALSSWPKPAIEDLLPPPDATLYGATGRLPEVDPEADPEADPASSPSAPVPQPPQDVSSSSSARGGSFPAAGGIPTTVLNAYRDAETRLGDIAPRCRLPWSLLAGIGKVESDHARRGAVDATGTTRSPIIGPVLDGSAGNAAITDTDNGALDGDTRWDRAVGPSQFIPSSWELYGADGNDDGRAEPHNVYDAAVGAGRYLCAGGLRLDNPTDLNTAVFRYNHSQTYVATVLAWARAYAAGAVTLPDSRSNPERSTPNVPRPTSAEAPSERPADDSRSKNDDDPKNAEARDTGDVGDAPRVAATPRALPRPDPATPKSRAGVTTATVGPHNPINDGPRHPRRPTPAPPPAITVIPVAPRDPNTPNLADVPLAKPATTADNRDPAPKNTSRPHVEPAPLSGPRPSPDIAPPTSSTRPASIPRSPRRTTPPTTTPPGPAAAPVSPILDIGLTADSEALIEDDDAEASGEVDVPPDPAPDMAMTMDLASDSVFDPVFESVFDSARGDFASHFDNHAGRGLVEGAPRPQFVAGPGGRAALSFTMPSGGKRAEVRPRVPANREGDELWVRYEATLRDLPIDTARWQLILQWHHQGNTGSPPIALEVGRGELRLAHRGGEQQSLGPISSDERLDLTLRIRFSRDPAHALVEAWRGGRQVLADYHPSGGTLLDASNYLKMGLYRDPAITQPSAMTVTRLRQGPTRDAVIDPRLAHSAAPDRAPSRDSRGDGSAP